MLALWAVPRSSSTAFERMMRQRGDHHCVHEPFGEVWYSVGNDDLPPSEHVQSRPDLTYESVWQSLLAEARRGPVFVKDFPLYVSHMLRRVDVGAAADGGDLEFLDAFRHSFLIRDPAKVLASLYGQWDHFTLAETGFPRLRELFDLLTQRNGAPPPLIDADDLLDDPVGVTAAWCEAMGIPPRPDALRWQSDENAKMTWYEGGTWHDNLARSNGFGRQERAYLPIDDNDFLMGLYEQCAPHYEALLPHRLGAKKAQQR